MATIQEIGNWLRELDRGQVDGKNLTGMNSWDHRNWYSLQDDHSRALCLRKYRRQIVAQFGEAAWQQIDASSVGIYYLRIAVGERVTFQLAGDRAPKDVFSGYVAHCKEIGAWFDKADSWFLPNKALTGFDLNKCVSSWKNKGFEVEVHIDEKKDCRQFAGKTKVKVDQRPDGIFEFRFDFNQALVDLFSNKKGQISGITEYDPQTKSRLTTSLELVEEALAKIKEIPDILLDESPQIARSRLTLIENRARWAKPIPGIAEKLGNGYSLFSHQNEAIEFFDRCGGNAFLSYDMGLGKTLCVLAWAVLRGKKVCVVCPKVVRRTWIQEAKRFFPEVFTDENCLELIPAKRKKLQADFNSLRLVTVNYESAEKFEEQILNSHFDVLVLDESHRCKEVRTKITKTMLSWAPLFAHKILLSGTAIKNRREELYPQIEMLRPGLYPSAKSLFGKTIGGLWHELQSFYLVRSRREALKDLPEESTQQVEIEIECVPENPKSIEDISRAKIETAKAKLETTITFIQELLDSSDQKLLVFSESVECAKQIADAFPNEAILHHGQLSDDARERAKAEFQDPECECEKRIFVSTRQSLAVGATLTAASLVVFNDLPWSAADIAQAAARCIRIGQKNAVNVYWMKASNSEFDSNVISIIYKKYSLAKALTEGKQLSPEERKFLEEPVSFAEALGIKKGK